MYALFLLALFFLPMLYADRYQMELRDGDDMFIPRSAAASYLFKLPIRQEQYQPLKPTMDDLVPLVSSDGDEPREPQRAKRIHWENLAFHATDFNKKTKKLY